MALINLFVSRTPVIFETNFPISKIVKSAYRYGRIRIIRRVVEILEWLENVSWTRLARSKEDISIVLFLNENSFQYNSSNF